MIHRCLSLLEAGQARDGVLHLLAAALHEAARLVGDEAEGYDQHDDDDAEDLQQQRIMMCITVSCCACEASVLTQRAV